MNQTNIALAQKLQREDLDYRLVVQMHPPGTVQSPPVFDVLNESVFVFRREKESGAGFRVSDGSIRYDRTLKSLSSQRETLMMD